MEMILLLEIMMVVSDCGGADEEEDVEDETELNDDCFDD